MNGHKPTRQQDEILLSMLDLRYGDGVTAKEAGRRFGLSKSAVLGQMHRVNVVEHPCACLKSENKDGGMDRRWWSQ